MRRASVWYLIYRIDQLTPWTGADNVYDESGIEKRGAEDQVME